MVPTSSQVLQPEPVSQALHILHLHRFNSTTTPPLTHFALSQPQFSYDNENNHLKCNSDQIIYLLKSFHGTPVLSIKSKNLFVFLEQTSSFCLKTLYMPLPEIVSSRPCTASYYSLRYEFNYYFLKELSPD